MFTDNFPLQFFVLDIVTIFLFITLVIQTYYILMLSKKISVQNDEIGQLRKVVYAVYEATKKDSDTKIEHHKLSKNGK